MANLSAEEKRRKHREYMREYYRKHPEKNRQHVRDWRSRNPDKKHIQDKLYRQRHRKQEAQKVHNWGRTLFGKSERLYQAIKKRQEVYGFGKLDFTLEEFRKWLFAQPDFKRLYDDWVRNNYHRNFTPTIDRINNELGYIFENMQVITNKENTAKSDGKCHHGIPKPFAGYPSQRQAALHLKINERELGMLIKKAMRLNQKLIYGNIAFLPDGTGELLVGQEVI